MLSLRNIQLLSILFGLLVSGYLSALKIADAPSVCLKSGPFNCDAVLNSKYSELAGIPIAWLGLAVYLNPGRDHFALAAQCLPARIRQPARFRAGFIRLALFDVAGLCAGGSAGRALPLVPIARDQFHASLRP